MKEQADSLKGISNANKKFVEIVNLYLKKTKINLGNGE